jgi:translation initiation factor IF-3
VFHPRHEELHITDARINERIRVPEVRLVGPNGEQVGIVRVEDALRLAQEADLDLVEVAPDARPPVCKLMDYGKFKYEADMKAREARRNQANTVLKEIRFRLKIDPHDYGTKKGHVERFLKVGDKVKVMIMFRGREQSRPEMGLRLLQRLADDVAELGFVESAPRQDGRNMIMVLGPTKKKSEVKGQVKRKPEPRVDAPAVTRADTAAPAAGAAAVAGPAPVAKAARALPAETVEAPEAAVEAIAPAEAASEIAAPTAPAPAEAAPAKAAPGKAAPGKAAPAKVAPAEVAPATVAPAKVAPATVGTPEVEAVPSAPLPVKAAAAPLPVKAAAAPVKAPAKAAPKSDTVTPVAAPSPAATTAAPRAMPKPTPRPAPTPAAALKPASRRPATGSTAAAPRPTRTPKAPPGDAESS